MMQLQDTHQTSYNILIIRPCDGTLAHLRQHNCLSHYCITAYCYMAVTYEIKVIKMQQNAQNA